MIDSMKRWTVNRPDEQLVATLANALAIPSVHAKILASRGITDVEEAKAFLHMDVSSMHNPHLLYDMDKAVSLIEDAIVSDQKIAVYGDYDGDGVTSVTVLMTALEELGADVFFAIPNRFTHGYGPNKELFRELHEKGTSLIITVDNGISGVDEIAYAKSLGMDVIVTDHHEIGEVLPPADAILHPRHPAGAYPFGELAGVGVAFKLVCALLDDVPLELLELVAIGTVADLVPLRDENRYFVKEGIQQMRTSKRPAIQALARVAGVEQSTLSEESIGFMIGPRLNAAGRLGDADPAVELLKTEDLATALALANELDALNKERQGIVSTITKEAEDMIAAMYGEAIPHVLVIAGEGWNAGVVGIVASRLTEKYYRPSIVLSIDTEKGTAKGSARSISGFDMFVELSKNAQLLSHFGGHQMAAGMSLAIADVEQLRAKLNEQAQAVLTAELLSPELHIDVPLSIEEIDVNVLESLELLRPFGMAFAKPVYLLDELSAASVRKIGAAKNHLKLEVTDGEQTLDTIGFGLGHIADQLTPGVKLSVAGDLQVNEWNGHKKPQLLIGDIRSDEWQLFDLRGVREPSRWLPTIPVERTLFAAFQEQTVVHFQSVLKGIAIHLVGKSAMVEAENLVLLDIPNDAQQLEELVRAMNPNRIYAHFYAAESKYFDGIPEREQFGWYYGFLKKRGTFDITKNGEQLTQHKGWKKETVYFMSKVFSELGFVKIENGVASFVEPVGKRDLSEAPSYQERQLQIELEKRLLYASYMELKQWFDGVRQETIDKEEQVWI
ncbi:single-stranded-DNA-specific exonuclease RecJ [Sporosarcina sp. FSL K6-1522]|uniref:single-stranded-DNA-specific exonuclease RecJ n=1 Tax=Sporosarcina sp. FSL K6-1522 TaxID=2921554 RepID=UPI00315AD851